MAVHDREEYATDTLSRQRQIEGLLRGATPGIIRGDIVAVIVPDANQLSAGKTAAGVYATLRGRNYDTIILVEPSHEAPFGRIHICEVDEYRSTSGVFRVNDSIRNDLCDEDDDIFLDDAGHFHSDGIQVQLPFLQSVLESPFDIVPIVMGEESPDFCRELGQAIGEIMYSRRTLLVVTASILTAEPNSIHVLRRYVESFDVSRLMALLNSAEIRVVGKGPVLVALIAALHRKATRAVVLDAEAPSDLLPGALGVVLLRE